MQAAHGSPCAGLTATPLQENPQPDRWQAPHSCGAGCDKVLACSSSSAQGQEAHTCLLMCHPGPCPPCPRQVCRPATPFLLHPAAEKPGLSLSLTWPLTDQ